ncbi:hypothetical protein Tco_1004475 [Tanacetum coccineum]|uniref:Uncharacterized protein n=1 Tax=Tanacetum coccineum TaxID=301880 RepID=A0ABQ5FDX5_9ASTR
MTSFDYRLNPIYAIKECSSCGSLYTSNCGCLKGSLKDKILVPKPPRNCARCAKCGTPIDGPYCQGCALLRKEFMEGLLTNCVENEFFKDFQDTSESSDDNTNVVNAPRGQSLLITIQNIDYVDASSPDVEIVSLEVVEIVDPEVGRIDDDILLTIKDDILREKLLNVNLLIAKINSLRDNPTPSSEVVIKSTSTFPNIFLEETNTFDNSIPESETFRFNLEEISSGSPTTHSELSLPDYKAFYIDNDHLKFIPKNVKALDSVQFLTRAAHPLPFNLGIRVSKI